MDETRDIDVRPMRGERLLARLDKMVAAGRMTDEEALRLRAAAESGDLDAEVQQIRFAHAKTRVDGAIADGRMTQDEAAAFLARVAIGEHPPFPHPRQRRWTARTVRNEGSGSSRPTKDGTRHAVAPGDRPHRGDPHG